MRLVLSLCCDLAQPLPYPAYSHSKRRFPINSYRRVPGKTRQSYILVLPWVCCITITLTLAQMAQPAPPGPRTVDDTLSPGTTRPPLSLSPMGYYNVARTGITGYRTTAKQPIKVRSFQQLNFFPSNSISSISESSFECMPRAESTSKTPKTSFSSQILLFLVVMTREML